jgi:hypothetical protein
MSQVTSWLDLSQIYNSKKATFESVNRDLGERHKLATSPGVNFINVIQAAITLVDPKSMKNTVKSLVSFLLLGCERIKAVHIMLMKLTPGDGTKLTMPR